MANDRGTFVISLDFELHWGAAEIWDLKVKAPYFDAARRSIPQVLRLFNDYDIRATWATVGFLFARDREQLLAFCPEQRPSYRNKKLSYYSLIENGEVGKDEAEDPYHFGASLIRQILETPGQELGTHTFAHYYCLEPGQEKAQFEADIKAAQAISKENFGVALRSLVYPRNQFNADYTNIAYQNGIRVVRTNPDVWFWKSESRLSPLIRAVDTLFPVSQTLSFKAPAHKEGEMLHLPASRFLRPFVEKEKAIRNLRLSRIKAEMEYAARHNRVYHLWWHPHNFGYDTAQNLEDLKAILEHRRKLYDQYGFMSDTMYDFVANAQSL